jgi:MOSC domain-containing protein YiiM
MPPTVLSVALSADHRFSKQVMPSIQLEEGLGVAGDCHAGVTVKHRSRVAVDPTQPNLRQVHLIHAELFDELATSGHDVKPGDLGENVATTGIDLLSLSKGTRLHLGATAIVELTGLRNPCQQIENFQSGLLSKVLGKAADGSLIRKSGVMAIVIAGGLVSAGDEITIVLPQGPHVPLERV